MNVSFLQGAALPHKHPFNTCNIMNMYMLIVNSFIWMSAVAVI